MRVYHYTTPSSYDEIMRTREFRPSTISTAYDAAYGYGWYFTDLPPSTSEGELWRLWGKCPPERTRHFLEFEIDRSLLKYCRPNVYLLPLETIRGGIINLDRPYILRGKTVIRFIGGGIKRRVV